MRMGKVRLTPIEYTVNLDDKEMVERAKDTICEDVDNAVKYNEIYGGWIEVIEDKDAKPEDIEDCLRQTCIGEYDAAEKKCLECSEAEECKLETEV